MAVGCTLIGSNTAPVREVIKDGRNGILVDFHDSEAVADAVIDVLSKPEAYAELGAAARRTVLDRFDKRRCVAQAVELVRSIGSKRAFEVDRKGDLALV